MHETYWGLRESPFRAGLDPRYFYESPTHDEALSRLKFLVENQRRLGLLLGGRGSGKSLLLEVLARHLRRSAAAVAQVSLLALETRELLWSLAAQLGICPPDDAETFALWRAVADRLAEHRYQQIPTVLLLDDAHEASAETLNDVMRLLHLDPTPEARLTVVLSANRFHAGRLGPRLVDLAELRIELEPWDERDTAAYLVAALETAGLEKADRKSPVFKPRAVARLHDLCRGVPRQICQLAELALLAAAGEQLSQIDESTIDCVYQELAATASAVQELALVGE